MVKKNIKSAKLIKIKLSKVVNKLSWILLFALTVNIKTPAVWGQEIVDQNINNQPLTIEGTSGGAVAAVDITQTEHTGTGYCDGFVRNQPNHVLQLESFFPSLRLEVQSSADTTIIVKGTGGIWCNDDSHSANPMIQGTWQPGIYQIWVGSYQADVSNSYRIKIMGE